jgi:hypothetical protein
VTDEQVTVRCPWCAEPVDLYIDPDTEGTTIEDCW